MKNKRLCSRLCRKNRFRIKAVNNLHNLNNLFSSRARIGDFWGVPTLSHTPYTFIFNFMLCRLFRLFTPMIYKDFFTAQPLHNLHNLYGGSMGYVYFIAAEGSDRVKIGFTGGQVAKRLADLQTGSPFPLKLIGAIRTESQATEKKVHLALNSARLVGEWFKIDAAKMFLRSTEALTPFLQWLRLHSDEDTPIGDLARDALRDGQFPEVGTFEDYRHHLEMRHACQGALSALESAFFLCVEPL